MTISARKTQLQVTHQISKTITFADAGLAAGVQIGSVPSGSVLGTTVLITSTAWNGTVSVALSVGTSLTGTQLINGSDVRTAAARVDTVVPVASAGPTAADVPIYASVAYGGTAGTTGSTTIVVTYWPNLG